MDGYGEVLVRPKLYHCNKIQCMVYGEVNNSFSSNDANDDDNNNNNGVVENENTILSCLQQDISALVAWR